MDQCGESLPGFARAGYARLRKIVRHREQLHQTADREGFCNIHLWCASQDSILIVPLARIRQVFFENDLSSPAHLINERRQGV